MNKVLVLIVVSLLGLGIVGAIIGITASNKEIALRSSIEKQELVREGYYDKMWKVIAQKAEVSNKYKNDFKEIYSDLIAGRYGNEKGGSLMKWIQESNPNFDTSLYLSLMNSIEAERTGYLMEEKKLLDLANSHRILRLSFPTSLFLSGRAEIIIKVVSSDKTKEILESGIDNDVKLFN
tara:strand:- start:13543 stop:14079 length:537 start_codon:yes stop_codon:yes gene_type:complete